MSYTRNGQENVSIRCNKFSVHEVNRSDLYSQREIRVVYFKIRIGMYDAVILNK